MSTKEAVRKSSARQDEPKERPAKTIRYGNVRITIWRQESDRGPWYSAVPSRTYRDQSGNWHSSGSFGVKDLLVLAKALNEAHSWICEQGAKDGASQANGHGAEENEPCDPEPTPF